MNTWVRKRKARGFTLVELLIVIVIIGILAGSMLLVFGSATDSAKATRIISEMRSLKAAALMYYADNNEWPVVGSGQNLDTDLAKYMDRTNPATGEYATYNIVSADNLVYVGDTAASADSGTWIKATVNTEESTVSDILHGGKGEEAGLATDGESSSNFYMILESTQQ
jgi:general secretion pathway protein G